MKQEVRFNECIGKTIEGMAFEVCGPQLVITFTDGTFSALEAENLSDEPDDVEITESKLDPLKFGPTDVVRLGIMSGEEIGNLRIERQAAVLAASENDARQLYESLKARFEPDTPNA